MKSIKYLFILSITILTNAAMAQSIKNYEQEWKKVDELVQKKNLPRSALEEVKKIYTMAKKDRQDAQIVKSLVYTTSLQQQNREDNEKLAIREIEKEIAANKEPAVSILRSLLASQYLNYFQRHRWQLYNRTNTVNTIKDDLATWTLEDFHKKISGLYLQSIASEKILQQTKLHPFNAIINKGNARTLRPTLYDLLAHHALNYFSNSERDIKKPAYAFEINEDKAFAPAAEFAAHIFTTKDSLSLEHKALLIYQELIKFHLKDAKPDALIDVAIDRIVFVNQKSTSPNKNELYIAALDHLAKKYGNNPLTAQARFLLAAHYENLAKQYQPLKDTAYRYERLKAKAILETVVKDSSIKSGGWANSYNLLKEITRDMISFEIEKVNVPEKPFRALVKYKAASSLNLRLVKATEELKTKLREGDEKYWSLLTNADAIRSWTQSLPTTNDLQEHSVEIKIDGLPVGEYILITTGDGNKNNTSIGAQFFHVSNISYINQADQFFVLHRESGQPLNNASVQLYTQQYDYAISKYSKTKLGNYKTDKNGFFSIDQKKKSNDRAYFLQIDHEKDHLFLDDLIYNYQYYGEEPIEKEEQKRIFFFTDRSIYRPGQTVYFKGIVITNNNEGNSIAANYKAGIYLRNANYEVVDSLQLTTNEFGSFNGKFTLFQNTLNGDFQIVDKQNQNTASFSVEEYKRPKFFVEFEKVKDTYKVGDTVTITANAKAYSGNNIDGATVSYRIIRQPRFIYPWIMWRGWFPQSEPMEIAHGETTTDKDGSFKISFTAIPDKTIDKKLEPVFDYHIYADVTDINGETRSAENIVSAGYKSLLLKLTVGERLVLDSFNKIGIRTENMNGEYQSSTVTVTISKLIPEQRLIRNRYWQQPDQFIMNKEEFINYFPHDEYKDESDFKNWEKGEQGYSNTDSTKVNGEWSMVNATLVAGFYVVEVTTKDKDGQEVKDVRYVELYDVKNNQLNKPEYLWAKGSKAIEPGEKTAVQIGSSAPDVFLIHQPDKPSNEKRETKNEFLDLNNEKKIIEFSASEKARGGYGVDFLFVKHNRFYQFSDVIVVPWTNKELSIEYATFRDKTLPGSEEKWKVKISGYKNEKVAAEMLASMYDASLDQFKSHSWSKPGIWPQYARLFNWQSIQNFSSVQSNQKWMEEEHKEFEKIYDQLQFNLYNHQYNKYSRELSGRVSGIEAQDAAAPQLQEVTLAGIEKKQNSTGSVATDSTAKDESETSERNKTNNDGIHIRKNFNETAFFFPDLKTDKDGNIEFSFTTPEALTRWKLQTLAHTKELAFGFGQKEIITQKELMVQPNAPRFLRQGDQMEFSVKIVNLSGKELTGQAEFQLLDATTNQSVDGWFMNTFPNQYFTVAAGASEVVKFPMEIPYQFTNALVWRVIAKAGNCSDGEEMILPVLTNKLLVTETIPLPMRGSGTKNFVFEKLVNSTSETLLNHSLTVEFTSNPAWYAVQALPFLMEPTNESTEGTWNRYYANALASTIVNSSPRIKQIFERWSSPLSSRRGAGGEVDTSALLSNLQKNQELKSALLEETPWVLQAKTEEQQKKNIALLFDLVRMNAELKSSFEKLKQMQSTNGGFVWMKGGPDDRYITQYIITSIGHLKKLGAIPQDQQIEIASLLKKAIPYLDKKIKEDHDQLVKNKTNLKQQNIGYLQIQYLYLRSFFLETAIPQTCKTAYNHYRTQAQQYWMKQNKYMQGMIALALQRTGDKQTPAAIVRSLKETAIVNKEMGMYWKNNQFGYSWFWWYAPIETQSLLIEVFSEIGKDNRTIDDLKTWLIKNKQTNNWRTSKATADACYALLLQGTNWLTAEPTVQIKLGNTVINNTEEKTEAGTGYFKKTMEGSIVKPAMGNISVRVQEAVNQPGNQPINAPSWGAAYWQYFENLDKITSAATPLQLNKKLFIEKTTDHGQVLTPVGEGAALNIGDKIKVRIELRVDRDMEYVHMKDMRASALEPINVLSGYKWQGGLGYYETTKDASTNFFFNYLRKGTYVFEYPLFVTHAGNFSNGITTIQSMYAPEFNAHSEGVRIVVE